MSDLNPPSFPDTIRGLARDFGLVEDEREPVVDAQAAQLAQAASAWPFALAAQLLALGIVAGAWLAPGGGPSRSILAMLVATPATAVLPWIVLGVGRAWPAWRRHRILMPAAAMLASALFALLWSTSVLPDGPGRLGAFVAVAGAIVISAVLLHPVRIATIGLGAGLVAGVLVLGASLPIAGVATAFFGCLAIATRRLARRDARQAMARAGEASEGQFAARMIAEFEDHGTGWFWETDRAGCLTYLSRKVADELVRVTGTEPLGHSLVELFRIDSAAPATERTLAFHLSSRTSFSDYSVRAAADETGARWWSISGRPMTDDLGRFQGFIGSGNDLTEKRRAEAEITRLALFDGLTGLANRQRMRVSLDKTLAPQAGPYRATALFLLDLDRFKAVNDTLGHQAGDELLKQAAQRLQRCVGESGLPGGLCGRLGGDEFQVLLPGIDAREALADLARTIIASLSQPYHVASQSVTIGCSIGIAIAPRQDSDAEALIRSADLALYAAKGDGRGVHRFYSDDMLAGAQSRRLLEDDLRHAVATGAFHLAYQPVVATADARVVGYEALLRWDHPTRGAISPALFVPAAEECGLIGAIGEWVLRTACAEAAAWPGDVRVAVNVSPIQFASPALPALVASALASTQLAPARLELEITEGVFLDQTRSSDAMFAALKGLGVRLALDDFGTGYSSLGYLRTAPFDKIKIDQSFVRGAAQAGSRNAAIIKAIVTLADTLGMETTAEGVEIQDEIDLVRSLGCSHIQGWVYGKAVPGEEARRQLAAAGGHAAASGFRVSRSPRTTMLRSARIELGQAHGDVRIRNISSTGAMIDGLDPGVEARGDGGPGIEVLIELLEDQMFPATLRWAEGGRAGLEFAEHFNLERLHSGRLPRRHAG
ncbi:putative bifunctional diguanylate cyclase/phosphodiesterase [Sphingomonas bacterium]|uniref:putative bifunctional diguanylate cyclase/phosphodiesterase n=1 Tax=Sphingomonas bacterium TaxID=1895847 RepID=UPI0015768F64|nr:bifunctional diguanylate cyclase/phosphodiesterase [Sphingomonas bacterium]